MYLCTQHNQKQAVAMYRNIIKQLKTENRLSLPEHVKLGKRIYSKNLEKKNLAMWPISIAMITC